MESWHRVFAREVAVHSTVNKVFEQFRVESKNTDIVYLHLMSGDFYEQSKINKEKDTKIKEVVLLYGTMSFENFCERLIANL